MKKNALNHVYRLIWSTQKQGYVPVAETTAAFGKRASKGARIVAGCLQRFLSFAAESHRYAAAVRPRSFKDFFGTSNSTPQRIYLISYCMGALLTASPLAYALDSTALPTEGQVVAGSASISQTNHQMTVHQQTDRMVANWSSFNIGEQALVQFQQPNAASIALNRVINSNPSEILGTLSANGQVYLVNPNGILFGRTAQVNVGGIVASTLDISNADFLNSTRQFTLSGSTGRVENLGTLQGGVIAFIAPEVSNSGTLSANNGSALLAAGNQVNLDFSGDGLVTVKVNQAAFNALAENKGLIQADGGLVMMSAQSANALMDTVVNHEGLIQANTLVNKNGRIILDGGNAGVTHVTGDIAATGRTGGDVIVTGHKVGLFDDAHLNVNGQFGAGNLLIGGGQTGADPSIHNANALYIHSDATLSADATDFGKGGTLIAYSTDSTQVHGHLTAQGGINGGDGGFIETSGGWLDISKAPNTASLFGNPGTWLIDPNNISIVGGGGNTNINTTSTFTPTNDTASLGITLINTALGSGNVTIQTASNGSNSQSGDITWNPGSYTYSGGNARTLTLSAHRHITVTSAIATSSGALTLNFTANTGSTGLGMVTVTNNLTTGGGNITFDGIGTLFNGGSAQTISTSNGTLEFNGEVILSNTNGVTLNTGNGNISFDGKVNSGNSYALTGGTYSWTDARTAARGGTYAGEIGDTYLANVTSDLEMSIISTVGQGLEYWIGGSDVDTEGTWKWMDGPEAGQTFWVSGTNFQGDTGYNGYNNAYVKWNTGEPNDAYFPGGEHYLQVNTNTSPVWNDLPNALRSLKGIVETNLAASPLTITAGTGTVTFGSTVGVQKALDSLSITAATIAMNGGGVTTENLQTYTGNMTLGSSSTTLSQTNASTNFTLAANKSITNASGGNATLLIKTTQDIILSSGSSIGSTSSTSTFGISLNARSGGGAVGSFAFNSAGGSGVALYSNGGNITLGGGTGNTDYAIGGNAYGVETHQDGAYLHTVILDTRVYTLGSPSSVGGGNISIKAKSYAGALTRHGGGLWTHASTFNTGGGNITLDAWGQRTSNASNGSGLRYGAYLETLTALTNGGNITITTPEEAASTPDIGMRIVEGTSLNSSTGNITLRTDRLYLDSSSTPTIAGTGIFTVIPDTAASSIGISGGTGTLALPAELFSTYLSSGFIRIEIGNSTAGAITLGASTTFNDDLKLVSGGNITLNADLNALIRSVTLTGGNGSTVSGSGNISAMSLLLNGTGATYTLNTASANTVSILAASGATALNFKNSGSLMIGAVTGVIGVTTTGATTIEANGTDADLTLSQPVTTTSGNIILAAGRNFINQNTSDTGITSSTGRYFVYSTTPVNSTEGMTGYSKHYDEAYVAGSTPAYASTGNWFIYSIAPVINIAVSNPQTITLGDIPMAFIPSYIMGLIDDDDSTIVGISGTPLFGVDGTNSTSGLYGVGAHTVDYIGGLSSSIGYRFETDSSSLNGLVVTPDLTSTVSGAQSGINGTANTESNRTASIPQTDYTTLAIIPGAGSGTIIEVGNNVLITNISTAGMQLVTAGSTTPISYTSQGNQLSLHLSANHTQPTAPISSNVLPVYQADTVGFVSQSAVNISDAGDRLTVSPAASIQQSIELKDIQTNQQVTSNVNSADGKALTLSVSITKEGLLIISVPEALFVTTNQDRMILLGIATAKENLGINVKSLRGIVVKKADLAL